MRMPRRIAREHRCLERVAGEEVFQRSRCGQGDAAQERDAAPRVAKGATVHFVPMDRAAELQSMLPGSVGHVVDKLSKRVRTLKLRPLETAQSGEEVSGKADTRQPSREGTAHARVKTVTRGRSIEIARQGGLVEPVGAEPDFIDPTCAGGKNPATSDHLGACVDLGSPLVLQFRKILHRPRVIPEKIHAADALARSEVVIDLGDYVVDSNLVGKAVDDIDGWIVVGGKSRAVASDRGTSHGAARNFQAGRADLDVVCKQISNRIRNTAATVASNRG